MRALITLLVLLPGLSACGLKGDLYLPPEPAAPPPPAAEATPAPPPDGTAPPTTGEDSADRGERRQVPPTPDRDQAR